MWGAYVGRKCEAHSVRHICGAQMWGTVLGAHVVLGAHIVLGAEHVTNQWGPKWLT